MTLIDQARDRLQQAIARAEVALEKNDGEKAAAQREALAALEASRAENASLRAANEDMSARLDLAIGRLKAVLDGPA